MHVERGLRAAVHPPRARSGQGSGIDVESRYAHLWRCARAGACAWTPTTTASQALAALRAAHAE